VFQALKRLEKKGLVVICRYDKKHPTYGFQKDYSKWKMSDFHKSAVNDLNLERKLKKKEREEKEKKEEKAHVDMTRGTHDGAYTKETLTKDILKEERKEREERDARERGENKLQVKPLLLSKEEEQSQMQNPKTKEGQRLHCWLVKEQAEYVKQYGYEDFEKVNWVQYVKQYYPGSRA
jgi:hypothetical protein